MKMLSNEKAGVMEELEDLRLFETSEIETQLEQAVLRLPRVRDELEQARNFGGWTAHKLDILRLYFVLYRRVAGNGTYIDGFAGTGELRTQGELRPGSVSVALEAKGFKNLFLYERPQRARKLDGWLIENASKRDQDRCIVRGGDFNKNVLEDLASGAIPKDSPCFAFLDPNSTELAWATVEALATYESLGARQCKVELWILFNSYQVLMRLMPKDGPPDFKTLDRWFGERSAWVDLYKSGAGAGRFAARYSDRLVELGYGAANPLLIRDPETGRPQYHMIHASDHPAAFAFMRWATKKTNEERFITPLLPGL